MLIKARNILESNGKTTVEFLCNYGLAKGIWIGDKPQVGHSYDVEIDMDDDLYWDKDVIKIAENETNKVSECDGKMFISGFLEESDPDTHYYVLRLGPYIFPFIAQGIPLPKGTPIGIFSKEFKLFPFWRY